MENCDYFVIGGGSGGVRSARVAAKLGAKVVLAERDKLGGTCINRGCIPKKIFSYASSFLAENKLAAGYGWQSEINNFDWQAFIAQKDAEVSRLNGVYQELLTQSGVKVEFAPAKILPGKIVAVGDRQYKPKHILLATGGRPRQPDLANIDLALNSDKVFDLPRLPKTALIVGGGYIGAELTSIFNSFGVKTDLAYRGELFLQGFDRDLRSHLEQIMTDRGVRFLCNTNVASISGSPGAIEVEFDNKTTALYEQIIFAIGREPNLQNIGLEHTKVSFNERSQVIVDKNMESTDKGIFAVGDISSRLALTPVALREGQQLAHFLFGKPVAPINYDAVPTSIFTNPNIATVGLTEEKAAAKGLAVKVYRSSFLPLRSGFGGNQEKCLLKLVVDADSDVVLGVHMLAEDAAEIMQGFAVAVNMKATKADFDATVGIHPTLAEELVTMS